MKWSIIVLSLIVAVCLLDPSIGITEPTHPNEVGLYTTPDGYGATGTYEIGVPVNVYLVLTKPTDMGTGMPMNAIRAFECVLTFAPPGNVFLLGDVLPPGSINIGDTFNILDGYLEYIVGMPDDWPIVNESVVLVELLFLSASNSPVEVMLGPTSPPCIPNEMAFVSHDFGPPYGCTIMHPVSGSHDVPVFLFNGEAIPVESESFGSVKALFR
jgi:hypothetical protein